MADEEDDTEGAFSAFEEDAYPEDGAPGYSPPPRQRQAPSPPAEENRYEEEGGEDPEPVAVRRSQAGSSGVRHKLAMASYYSALEGYAFFEGDDGPEAEQIRADLKAWIESQMEVLVGGGQDRVSAAFSDEEVRALKILAARVLAAPVSPRPAPLPAATRPVVSRPVSRPSPVPVRAAQPPAAKPKKRRPAGDPRSTGETFEEGGQLFRYVTNPEDPAGPKVKLNVTRSSRRPPTAAPFPSDSQMASITADLADRTTRAATRGDAKLQRRIIAALNTP